jgi:hypothetical protein
VSVGSAFRQHTQFDLEQDHKIMMISQVAAKSFTAPWP